MAGVDAMLTHSCASVQIGIFLEPHPQGPFLFTYISMFRIVVAGDVIDRTTLSFFRGLVL